MARTEQGEWLTRQHYADQANLKLLLALVLYDSWQLLKPSSDWGGYSEQLVESWLEKVEDAVRVFHSLSLALAHRFVKQLFASDYPEFVLQPQYYPELGDVARGWEARAVVSVDSRVSDVAKVVLSGRRVPPQRLLDLVVVDVTQPEESMLGEQYGHELEPVEFADVPDELEFDGETRKFLHDVAVAFGKKPAEQEPALFVEDPNPVDVNAIRNRAKFHGPHNVEQQAARGNDPVGAWEGAYSRVVKAMQHEADGSVKYLQQCVKFSRVKGSKANVKDSSKRMGFIRVLGPNPCPLCIALAAVGATWRADDFVKSDAKFDGPGDAKVHNGCNCTLQPFPLDGSASLPASTQRAVDLWNEHRSALKSMTPRERLAYIRRAAADGEGFDPEWRPEGFKERRERLRFELMGEVAMAKKQLDMLLEHRNEFPEMSPDFLVEQWSESFELAMTEWVKEFGEDDREWEVGVEFLKEKSAIYSGRSQMAESRADMRDMSRRRSRGYREVFEEYSREFGIDEEEFFETVAKPSHFYSWEVVELGKRYPDMWKHEGIVHAWEYSTWLERRSSLK